MKDRSKPTPELTERQLENFWVKIDKGDKLGPGGCWLWTAGLDGPGYGGFKLHPLGMFRAHRISYKLMRGAIPLGLEIDHLCRVRKCVNPDHLEAVTNRTNNLRGISPAALNAEKTHCKQGHEFSSENTHTRSDGGRRCRTCIQIKIAKESKERQENPDSIRERDRLWYARNRVRILNQRKSKREEAA